MSESNSDSQTSDHIEIDGKIETILSMLWAPQPDQMSNTTA